MEGKPTLYRAAQHGFIHPAKEADDGDNDGVEVEFVNKYSPCQGEWSDDVENKDGVEVEFVNKYGIDDNDGYQGLNMVDPLCNHNWLLWWQLETHDFQLDIHELSTQLE